MCYSLYFDENSVNAYLFRKLQYISLHLGPTMPLWCIWICIQHSNFNHIPLHTSILKGFKVDLFIQIILSNLSNMTALAISLHKSFTLFAKSYIFVRPTSFILAFVLLIICMLSVFISPFVFPWFFLITPSGSIC